MADPLVELALDYYRDPLAYRHLAEVERPLPQGFGAMLADFCAALSSARIAETAAQLSVDPAEMEEAARFFVRHVMLSPAGDYYRHLGLNRDAPQESIRHHYQLLIRMFHPDRVAASTEVGAFYATRLNLAYQTLRDPETRAAYDFGLPRFAPGFTETDPAWFFRPSQPELAGKPSGWFGHAGGAGAGGRHPHTGVTLIGAVVLGVLVLVTGYVLNQANTMPKPRFSARGGGAVTAPPPSYLAPSPRTSGSGARAVVTTADEPLPPIGRVPVDRALFEQDGAGKRAVEDASQRLAEVPQSSPVSAAVTPARVASSVMPGKKIDAGRLGDGQSESGRIMPVVPHDDLAKGPEHEALVIPPVAVASSATPGGREVAPPRPAEVPHQLAMPLRTRSQPPWPPGTRTGTTPKVEPTAQEKAVSNTLPAEQPKATTPAKSVQRRSDAPVSDGSRPMPIAPVKPARSASSPAVRVPGTIASLPVATPEQDAEALVASLESAYAARNADGFAALFKIDARINEGSGRALIRSKYAELFQRTTGAKLAIRNVRWRSLQDGRISGSGTILVGNQYHGGEGWRYAKGGVDLVLIRDADGYRFASLFYSGLRHSE